MRAHHHRAPIFTILLAAVLLGCLTEPESNPLSPATERGSTSEAKLEPPRHTVRHVPHSDGVTSESTHQAAVKREAALKRSQPAASMAPGAEPSNSIVDTAGPAPVVSLQTPADSKAQAQAMVDQAFQRLGRIDRTFLKGDAATTYDQATALAESGRKALQDGDFTAAEGYAHKASTLAADLDESVPRH